MFDYLHIRTSDPSLSGNFGQKLEVLREQDAEWEGRIIDDPDRQISWFDLEGDEEERIPKIQYDASRNVVLMGNLASSESLAENVEEVRKQLENWVDYAREKFPEELPSLAEWRVSQLRCWWLSRFTKWTGLADLERVAFPKYETRFIRGERVRWVSENVRFGFHRELGPRRLKKEGRFFFKVFLKRVRSALPITWVERVIQEEQAIEILERYYEKVMKALPRGPSDLEVYRKAFGATKWEKPFAFAMLTRYRSYSPALMEEEGWYGSQATPSNRKRTLKEAELWERRKLPIQLVSPLPPMEELEADTD